VARLGSISQTKEAFRHNYVGQAVGFLTTNIGYGGASKQLLHLATRVKARGWDVRVISITQPKAFVKELESSGIPLVSLETTCKAPLSLLKAYVVAVKILRSWRPHFLHCHMVHANILGRATRLSCHIPVLISTSHSINEGGKLREVPYCLSDPLADLTTIISQAAGERYMRIWAVPRRKRMGEAGRRYVVEHYELEHVVDVWDNLYRELLSKKGLAYS